ncbi:MAG: helix-turn-helix domain-containing protein [Lachnospiraceae bacterium]|nr:helix-turn-helix domain-containing protein [Lachnospiraceae bacterium]
MNLYSRILELCKLTGDTMYSLAKHSGVSESALSRLKTNSQVKMSKKNIILLANYFCVNEDWLATGEGDRNAPGVTKDSLIHDGALHSRFLEVSQTIFGNNEDKDEFYITLNVDIEVMAAFTNISADRLWQIIYDKHYPSYTEVISLLKSDQRINANWLLTGVGEMFKTYSSLDVNRIATLVDTIATLQKTISEKDKTIAILAAQVEQLKNQTKK